MIDKLLEKKPNNLFLQFLANKKVIYSLYLVIWIIIVLVLYLLFIKPSSNMNTVKDNNSNLTYPEFKEILQNNNYSYNFVVTDNDVKTIYNGDKLANEEVGYMDNVTGTSKYYIKDNIYYNVINFNIEQSDSNPFAETYFDADVLIQKLDSITPEVNDNIYVFKSGNFYGKINLEKSSIIVIDIDENGKTYSLEYANIGNVQSINY